ncbi:MAG TPA: cohesin domain-containing protein [Candidatus Acidoferrales bacterium]|nr:cohesin domain-containing protein [Candidatus Acidoferrales bacterium]
MRRALVASFVAFAAVAMAGCGSTHRNKQAYKAGFQAETIGDYDAAVIEYDKALKSDPLNTEFKLHDLQAHFAAGQFHVEQGEKALKKGALEMALGEFEKAEAVDPSSTIAQQDAQKTLELLAKVKNEEQPKPVGVAPPEDLDLMSAPPELKPLSREPLNLKVPNEDPHMIFQTIAQLAGISVIFDPSFQSRPVTADFDNVTLEQALNAVSLESNAFWKPITDNIIFVAQESPENRRKYEDEEVQTFYVHNNSTPQELNEISTLLRQLLDTPRIAQVGSANAIVVRATPDKLMLASKVIDSIDKLKAEVVVKVDVMEARRDHETTLGIQPGTSASLTFTGVPGSTSSSSGSGTSSGTGTTTTTPTLPLNGHLTTGDYSLTLPGATLNALLTDSTTHLLQDPNVRIEDGATAKLAIGDKVPIATGSFQAGVGVTGTAGVSPLVNTQFQYQEVGVNLEVTPRIHPDGQVSMKISVDVSAVASEQNIGGIQQPVIAQNKIDEGEITVRDGEVTLLGGLLTQQQQKSISGWPGLAKIPFFRYFFSSQDVQTEDDDIVIAITPHIVRMPSISEDDLRTLASGTENNVQVYPKGMDGLTPQHQDAPAPGSAPSKPQADAQGGQAAPGAAALQFQPQAISMKPGDTMTVGLAVSNVQDLYSIPLLLQYNPAVIQVEDVRNGGFLSGGTQNIAIVHQENQQQGQSVISATRSPNTPGISGSGTLFGIVIKAIAPGTSQLQILQVNARDSQQKPVTLTSGTASVQVQ